MDVMAIRRMLLNTIGGGSVSLGGLTKYQKISAEPVTNGMYLDFTHNLGIKPKFILVKPASGETVSVDCLEYMVGDDYISILQITNSSTGKKSRYPTAAKETKAETATSNGSYWFDGSEGRLRQYSNSAKWETGVTYEIELWA